MARPVARLVLTDEERNTLVAWSRLSAGPNRMVERARIILLAADGLPAREIARRLRTRLARVSKWRNRFSRNRLTGLQDAPRPGKPNTYDEQTEKRMLALWIPIRRMATVSGMDDCWRKRWETSVPITCGGFFEKPSIQLQRRRSWCISTDPEFGSKAADVVGLYLNPPQNAVVLCVDEKPHIQVLERAQGWLRLPNGKALNGFNHCYKRHGTSTLFAAPGGGNGANPGGPLLAAAAT